MILVVLVKFGGTTSAGKTRPAQYETTTNTSGTTQPERLFVGRCKQKQSTIHDDNQHDDPWFFVPTCLDKECT
jgi:hypothetical protein